VHEPSELTRGGMLRRFLLAAILIVLVAGGATAAVALNTVGGLAGEVFNAANKIHAPKGLVVPEYSGGPQTFLVLGSDRRSGSKNAWERSSARSDTILLVRFDPEQGQTSVLSIPRDLLVAIHTPSGGIDYPSKINAAYSVGSELGGSQGASLLVAQTIKREVFPELKLNGIVDVNFRGFINVVDTLGCAYVNVDHRYFNENVGTPESDYSNINIEPGYQKLCNEQALEYVRYRHTDTDFVRVARQQDFLRALREQVDPEHALEQIDRVAKAVGGAITSTFPASSAELIELAKLVAFSQNRPLRQVKFQFLNEGEKIGEGDYVTSSPELERATLHEFLYGAPRATRVAAIAPRRGRRAAPATSSPELIAASAGSEAQQAQRHTPLRVLYPALQTPQAEPQEVRDYRLLDSEGRGRNAYVAVFQQNIIGGYYDVEGTDWLDPPLFDHSRTEVVDGRTFKLVDDGSHVHVIGWRQGADLYWVTNTLTEELSNAQLLAIALSARPVP
jgi:LCP family protein required for cell wall assembly